MTTAHPSPAAAHASPTAGRLRTAWAAAHTPVPGVPRWARIAARAVPFTVLPSSAWRIATCTFHVPLDGGAVQDSGNLPWWLPLELYVVLLSAVSELFAFAALGLVARWGEVFPCRLPLLGGRPVPVAAAVVPAVLGATVLTVGTVLFTVMLSTGRTIQGRPLRDGVPVFTGDWHTVVLIACYAPLLLWGPLLAAVTVAYRRRRRARQS
ncbi:hypothetical protein [Kitasatospora cathayae]|uniref:Integral membrane protein n=1 Tax=Kitasatospora cathayae TaxID=3004092 RepID=A0ABY7QB97_9ACTN|nr:hypothetical protein [Kitasatospora sp. HUAS 3-15]WBP89972.1 hypothetical protein O1G21_31760 [Kitasatospora sp. HUAS 3-15]